MTENQRDIDGTILLVDDELQILRVITARLKRSLPRIDVLPAQSGLEAMRLLDTHHVDLIISDHRMPGMDGITFLAHAQRQARAIPRVMLTGYADAEMAVRAVNDGHVAAFFQKPAIGSEFEEHIERLLDARLAALERDRAFAAAEAVARARSKGART